MGDTSLFTRDSSLGADVADQFGGGGGNAEALVEANNLRFSSELQDAQFRPGNSNKRDGQREDLQFSKADVAKAADLDEDAIKSYDLHERYVVFAFETPDGRLHKDVLLHDDGDLNAIEGNNSPAKAAIRAQLAGQEKTNEAKSEAEKIIAEAQAEADRIRAEAASEVEQDRAKAIEDASEAEQKEQAKKAESGGGAPRKLRGGRKNGSSEGSQGQQS